MLELESEIFKEQIFAEAVRAGALLRACVMSCSIIVR